MKIRPVGAQLFHADWRKGRRTDMTKIIFGFRSFSNKPKNSTWGLEEGEKGVRCRVRKEMERSKDGKIVLVRINGEWYNKDWRFVMWELNPALFSKFLVSFLLICFTITPYTMHY